MDLSNATVIKVHLTIFTYGGIAGHTFDCLVDELGYAAMHGVEIHFQRVAEDALISRSRSYAASKFLKGPCEVMFMLDHDIQCEVGDIIKTCQKAIEAKAIIGGMYSFRSRGNGHSSRLARRLMRFPSGLDELIPAEYVASGFMAIPKVSIEAVVKHESVRECLYLDGSPFWDLFRPLVVSSTTFPGKLEYLSEDWSFCHRAREVGVKQYVYALPKLKHHGDYGYTVEDGIRGN